VLGADRRFPALWPVIVVEPLGDRPEVTTEPLGGRAERLDAADLDPVPAVLGATDRIEVGGRRLE
jgi:hypothetical protein